MCSARCSVLLDAVKGTQFYREGHMLITTVVAMRNNEFVGRETLTWTGLVREGFMGTLCLSWFLKLEQNV